MEDKFIVEELKKYINDGEYKKAIKILRNEIIKLVIEDIKMQDSEYEFSTFFDLVDKTEKISYKYRSMVKNLYNIDEYSDLDEVSELLEMYEIIKKNK